MGTKEVLSEAISSITKIEEAYLLHRILVSDASVAKRMSWASHRRTTRQEDEAYALLGLFDVNMPLLYGEGPKAFTRLQEEIIKSQSWPDHFILVHSGGGSELLAFSARQFADSNTVVSWPVPEQRPVFDLTSTGLDIRSYLLNQTVEDPARLHAAGRASVFVLNCSDTALRINRYALKLRPRLASHNEGEQGLSDRLVERVYERRSAAMILHWSDVADGCLKTVHISRTSLRFRQGRPADKIIINASPAPVVISADGTNALWDDRLNILNLYGDSMVFAHFPMLDSSSLANLSLSLSSYLLDQGFGAPALRVQLYCLPGGSVDGNLKNIPIESWKDMEDFELLDGNSKYVESTNGTGIVFKANYVQIAYEMLWRLDVTTQLGLYDLE